VAAGAKIPVKRRTESPKGGNELKMNCQRETTGGMLESEMNASLAKGGRRGEKKLVSVRKGEKRDRMI